MKTLAFTDGHALVMRMLHQWSGEQMHFTDVFADGHVPRDSALASRLLLHREVQQRRIARAERETAAATATSSTTAAGPASTAAAASSSEVDVA